MRGNASEENVSRLQQQAEPEPLHFSQSLNSIDQLLPSTLVVRIEQTVVCVCVWRITSEL